jgi:type I restriction enzyme S subunit
MKVPWSIPEHWSWKTMDDIAEVVGGGTPRTDRHEYYGGDIPWITPADLSGYNAKKIAAGSRSITRTGLDNSGARLMPRDTVLFSSRAPIGYVAVAANPLSTNQGFKNFVVRDGVEPDYVYYYLQRARQFALDLASGTTFLEISGKKAGQIPVPIPPVDEQIRVVAEIEKHFTRLDAGIAALDRVQTSLKRYRATVLKAAGEGRLVPHEATLARRDARSYETGDQLLNRVLLERRQHWSGRGRYAEASLPEGAELPSIPVGWAWTTLDTIAEIKGGITKDQKRKPSGARAVPYLRVANVQRGYLDLSEMKEILATKEEIAELALRPGDILFNEGGDRDKLGRGWVWSGQIPVCIHQNHVFRARLYDRALQPKFVSWYANWLGQRFFFDKGKHTTNLASISMSKLRLLPIPIPPPAEQIRIVVEVERVLSVIDALEVALAANVLRASHLRESILHRAFSGRFSRTRAAASNPATAVSPQRRHFARAVLSAEIVTRLHREPTFGRIKHQKIFHLCEHVARISEIQGEYHREAAGPLDNRLIYANEAELKKQHWFKTVRRDGHGHCYEPMAKVGGHRKYADRYWPTQLALIERLIELMRTWKTDRCEIFSTVYAAWNDLILWQRPVTDDAVVHEILNRWHSAKRQIPETRWRKAIQWVRENGFEPTGFGRATASPE